MEIGQFQQIFCFCREVSGDPVNRCFWSIFPTAVILINKLSFGFCLHMKLLTFLFLSTFWRVEVVILFNFCVTLYGRDEMRRRTYDIDRKDYVIFVLCDFPLSLCCLYRRRTKNTLVKMIQEISIWIFNFFYVRSTLQVLLLLLIVQIFACRFHSHSCRVFEDSQLRAFIVRRRWSEQSKRWNIKYFLSFS